MKLWFNTQHLDIERLLSTWRWLCPEPVTLIARNVFGDLFLYVEDGRVLWLDVGSGSIREIATTKTEFFEALDDPRNRDEWLAESESIEAEKNGLVCSDSQCIGFKIPTVFAESASVPDNAYIADLYERVAFLGELHRQLHDVPDGRTIRLQIEK